ncbi:hypothetical protein LA080_008287 [Diaporthe eres]|nr:hypothetical protein LA080_008287 [Diaporthe eres]
MLRVEKLLEELGEDQRQQQESELNGVNAQNQALNSKEEVEKLRRYKADASTLRIKIKGLRAGGAATKELSALHSKELVEYAISGEDVYVFTYSQTGSGKTMMLNFVLNRLAGALFNSLAKREKVGWRFGVHTQLLKVYGSALYNIAVSREQVKFQSTSRSPTVPSCTKLVFKSVAEMRLALEGSGRWRTTAAT